MKCNQLIYAALGCSMAFFVIDSVSAKALEGEPEWEAKSRKALEGDPQWEAKSRKALEGDAQWEAKIAELRVRAAAGDESAKQELSILGIQF